MSLLIEFVTSFLVTYTLGRVALWLWLRKRNRKMRELRSLHEQRVEYYDKVLALLREKPDDWNDTFDPLFWSIVSHSSWNGTDWEG